MVDDKSLSKMFRKQLSGAQKRNLAIDKKKKEEELAKKIPKINAFFGQGPSESISSGVESEENSTDVDISERETDPIATQVEVEAPLDDDATSSDIVEFSNDAALWHVPSDALQEYWISNGK